MGNTDKFDMIASVYDTADRVEIARVSSDAIREVLIEAKNKEAIDFGCGTGLVGMNLLDEFKSVLFLDTSPNMIQQINQKISNLNIKNATTLCFDFEKSNLSELRTDYLFMAQVLLHIENYRGVLSKLYHVLNPGGHLIIIDFIKNDEVRSDMVHNGFQLDKLTREMAGMGFVDIHSKVFYTGSKIFMGQDASMFILDSRKG